MQHVARPERVDDLRGGDGRRVQDRRRPLDRRRRPCGPGPARSRRLRDEPRPEVGDAVEQVRRRRRGAGSRRTAPRGRRARAGRPARASSCRRRGAPGCLARDASAASTCAAPRWWPSTSSAVAPACTPRARGRGALRSGTPTALTETTARSPVARVTSTVDTAGVPGAVEQVDDLDPRRREPGADEVGDRSRAERRHEHRADPERGRRRRRVRRRAAERDVQAPGDDLLVGGGQPVDHLHDVERRQAAADQQRRHATRAGCDGRSTRANVATPSTRAATSDRRPGADHAAERVRQREAAPRRPARPPRRATSRPTGRAPRTTRHRRPARPRPGRARR